MLVYGLTELQKDCINCYESGYFSKGASDMINEALKLLMIQLRPQILNLVEAFQIPDSAIPSTIGNFYGDIYSTQLEQARKSSLNKQPVLPGFKEYISPII